MDVCPHCRTEQPRRASGRFTPHDRGDGEPCTTPFDERHEKRTRDADTDKRKRRSTARREWRRRKSGNSTSAVEQRAEALERHLERYGDLNTNPSKPASNVAPHIVAGGLPGTSRRH